MPQQRFVLPGSYKRMKSTDGADTCMKPTTTPEFPARVYGLRGVLSTTGIQLLRRRVTATINLRQCALGGLRSHRAAPRRVDNRLECQ